MAETTAKTIKTLAQLDEATELNNDDLMLVYQGNKNKKLKKTVFSKLLKYITKVQQTKTSTVSEGENEVTVTYSNSDTDTFVFKNGSRGEKGDDSLSYNTVLTISLEVGSYYTFDNQSFNRDLKTGDIFTAISNYNNESYAGIFTITGTSSPYSTARCSGRYKISGEKGEATVIYSKYASGYDHTTLTTGKDRYYPDLFGKPPKIGDISYVFTKDGYLCIIRADSEVYDAYGVDITKIDELFVGIKSVNLTWAEYQALPASKNSDGVYYNITDYDSGNRVKKYWFEFTTSNTQDDVYSQVTSVLGTDSACYVCDAQDMDRIIVTGGNVYFKYWTGTNTTDPSTLTCASGNTTNLTREFKFYAKKVI